jgi:type II secretory pathway pseudopilin PulG
MKILPDIPSADAKTMRRQGERAFTMVEIAIAIGVIGFALVAIIGLLPRGLTVQKTTREDTVISQDAAYFLDAIRNGAVVTNFNQFTNAAHSLDFLTNYVQSIRFDYITTPVGGVTTTNATSNYNNFFSGAEIIGLLSTPQTNYLSPFFSNNFFYVTATNRALSGPATEDNGLNNVMSFKYRMEVMITPFNSFAPDTTNWSYYAELQNVDPNQVLIRSNRWVEASTNAGSGAGALTYNLFNVRLRFSWPVFANGSVGEGRQTYCTVVGSQLVPFQPFVNGPYYWFFQPQTFANSAPSGL